MAETPKKENSKSREIFDLANDAAFNSTSWSEFFKKASKLDEAVFPSLKKSNKRKSDD